MLIGDPVSGSLSPLLHNCGYQAAGISDKFIYVAAEVQAEILRDAIKGIRALKVRGVSCTMPHKQQIMKYLDEVDPIAQKIGAVNTVVNYEDKLVGYNTDWLGVVKPLENVLSLSGKKVAIIGAGGAARAACFGLTQRGCHVKVFNRTARKAKALSADFDCKFGTLAEQEQIQEYDIVFNATPLGMFPNQDISPLSKDLITKDQVVFDSVYHPQNTLLLRDAVSRHATIISGAEMLLQQAVAQFELFTGCTAPVDKMRSEMNMAIGQETGL
jgi:shikimate dehydrogenase